MEHYHIKFAKKLRHLKELDATNRGFTLFCQPINWSVAAILRDSVAFAVVVSTRPRTILLAMITTRKSNHEFPFFPTWVGGSA